LAPLYLLGVAGHSFSNLQPVSKSSSSPHLPFTSLFTYPPHNRRARSLGSDVLLSVSAPSSIKLPSPAHRPLHTDRLTSNRITKRTRALCAFTLPFPRLPPSLNTSRWTRDSRDIRCTSSVAPYALLNLDSCPLSLVLLCAHCAISGSCQVGYCLVLVVCPGRTLPGYWISHEWLFP
jgi:hypothetical protein